MRSVDLCYKPYEAAKAKLIYLTHHLGLNDAILFIKNKITEDKAVKLLNDQTGVKSTVSKKM